MITQAASLKAAGDATVTFSSTGSFWEARFWVGMGMDGLSCHAPYKHPVIPTGLIAGLIKRNQW